jgi:DNA topoisomerase-2
MALKKKIEERYKKLTPKEHILKKPGMYIGNVYTEQKNMYVFEDINEIKENKFKNKTIDFNAGFIKLFDEVLTNASDHYIRTNKVKYIKITVEKDHIIIENDGPGIPVQIHKEHKIYVPELIFGHLLTGENFDDSEERMVGGTHGLGLKLTNIFSKKFTIETSDGKKRYIQTFTNNMDKKTKPKITATNRNKTKITYYPDFEKFELTEITDEIQSIFLRRAIDIAAYNPSVNVYYNKTLIPIKSFKDYMKMFLNDNDELFYEKINDYWEIGISNSKNDIFEQVSMVNGISTHVGGTHVNYITNQIIKALFDKLIAKKVNVNGNIIRNQLFLFLNCKIPNPAFETQTKENLTTRIAGNVVKPGIVPEKFIKKLYSSKIKDNIVNFVSIKEFQDAKKATQNKVTPKVKIAKLDDANKAGKMPDNMKCHLFLTEGDSAASTAKRGFSVTGNDYYGLFPLKGKPLNVRDITLKKMRDNEEISNIITALGLEFGKKYTSTRTLRYGKLVIMSDMDPDGNHIKGLILNLFDTYWPELLELDFIYEFITPIVKVKKNKIIKYFYRQSEYKQWKKITNTNGYFIKYYKGLGTIEPSEAKLFFKDISKHLIRFNVSDFKRDQELIDLAFNKKKIEERKNWLSNYKPGIELDKFKNKQTYDSFFNNEFIEFSMSDNIRSIPSLMDGLKPSQRKILYTLFKRNFKNEVKVELLMGSVMEMSAYHHGACLDYNTEIFLADGSYIKIGEWCERYPDVELLLYCVDDNNNLKISVGKNPITIKQELEYIELELEDGTIIECTENHKFLINNEFIEAKYLKEGMNILDFNNSEKDDF